MGGQKDLQTVSTKLHRIATMAARLKGEVLTTLFHRMDEDMLRTAYTLVRKDGATGVDKVSGEQYAANLSGNLEDLFRRLKDKRYRAPMVRTARIPKADGGERVLGIPTFEDKIVQKAVSMLLEPVYEQDFLNCSYGFRPKRNAHQALHDLRTWCMENNVQWVLDADIKTYFDTIPHALLQDVVKKRVNDGDIIRLIGKWLHTGTVDLKQVSYRDTGTPQGGVISPLLANIYLHEVLDTWFERDVRPRLRGRGYLVRYADDFIIGFEREEDARRMYKVLPKRFAKYGLTIHPDKTRLRRFGKPRGDDHDSDTFDFLGFTHYWAKSLKGNWVIKRKTACKRMRRTLKAIWAWCKEHRHDPLPRQHRTLCAKIRGHYQYFGVRHNLPALSKIRHFTEQAWRYWRSRCHASTAIPWQRWRQFLARHPLPIPRVIHAI